MSHYKEYIKGLCPEADEWVINQICGELDLRDYKLAKVERELEDLKLTLELPRKFVKKSF